MNVSNIKLSSLIPDAIKVLFNRFEKYYLVGGAVRNYLYGNIHDINDWDIVIFDKQSPQYISDIIRAWADEYNYSYIDLDLENYHYRVVCNKDDNHWQLDITLPRGQTIEDDLQERDISINAIAYNIQGNNFINDAGIQDIQDNIINIISQDNLEDDLLRCLRAYRFLAKYNAQFSCKSIKILRDLAHKYKELNIYNIISPERINYELWEICHSDHAFIAFKLLYEHGWLEIIIPEFITVKYIPSNSHHHLPLWEHTLELIHQYENYIQHILPIWISQDIKDHSHLIKMGMLLHDIAKPVTWDIQTLDNNLEKHTFYNHDILGANIVLNISKRLKWSKIQTKFVYNLVKYHLRPFQFANLQINPTDKAINKLIRKCDNSYGSLIILAWADMLSVRGQAITPAILQLAQARIQYLLNYYNQYLNSIRNIQPLLSGDRLKQLITQSKLPPTKVIKQLLNHIEDLQIEGKLHTQEQAEEYFLNEAHKIICQIE